uniref:Uncharacterized protein n=1 Tax=uncultured organism MedDCM-OCT-S04-C777 TaxID=743619 RepID=D6PK98_9ZZZZ|nr:hypothetical protein [uncultured organism MedDCM-OCT-S04-C777]
MSRARDIANILNNLDSTEVYGFNKNASDELIVTTTNSGWKFSCNNLK